jgi:hypothetical protein
VRRTWSPRGRTPVLRHRFGWKKASMAAALGYRPDGTAARLCFHLQQPGYTTDALIEVLDPVYLADYQTLVAEVQAQDVGLIIKVASRRNWPEEPGEHGYTTWYEPFDDQQRIDAAVAWVLSHPEVTGIATPGDVRLLPLVVEAERRLPEISLADAEQVLAGATDYSSLFLRIPF